MLVLLVLRSQRKFLKFCNEKNINHSVLNAKQHEKEAKIIAEAGKIGSIQLQQIWQEEVPILS